MICKLEHMCYLNVQAPITTENPYSLFVTAKRNFKNFSFFQSEGNTIWAWNGYWSKFLRDIRSCYFFPSKVWLWILKNLKSSVMKWGQVLTFKKCWVKKGVWVFEKVRPNEHICIYPVWYPVNTWCKNTIKHFRFTTVM
jgi:hypothetical protein